MDNSYWYKLIEDRVLVQNKTGYTLPFLIGAQEVVNMESPIGIKELLEDMRLYHEQITIRYCFHTREYIVKESEKFSIKKPNELVFDNLTIIPFNNDLQWVEDFEDVKTFFDTIYSKIINDGHFSKIVRGHNIDWQDFESDEKDIIKRILNVK